MAKKSDTTRSTENESQNDFDKQNSEILWFKDLYAKDIDIAGGKGANLGEMTQNGAPVPPGFVITVSTYRKFLTDSNLEDRIKALLTDLDVNDSKSKLAPPIKNPSTSGTRMRSPALSGFTEPPYSK